MLQIAARKKLPLYVLLGSIAAILFLVAYVAANGTGEGPVGEGFVNEELPPPGAFPYFLKPITWLMIVVFAGWFSFLELMKDRLKILDSNWRYFYAMVLFIITAISFYEILFNFMYWGAILSRQSAANLDPDSVANGFPSQLYQVNIVFATKVGVTIFACAVYAFAVLKFSSNK
ncbi:MAG: hypothetical protein ABI348_03385 [Nitrososphaera sp.]|jgi:hypothetical protein|nr:hypothetical protein [uncultured Nitrososphaera sp.]